MACVAHQSKQILCKDRILFWGGDFLILCPKERAREDPDPDPDPEVPYRAVRVLCWDNLVSSCLTLPSPISPAIIRGSGNRHLSRTTWTRTRLTSHPSLCFLAFASLVPPCRWSSLKIHPFLACCVAFPCPTPTMQLRAANLHGVGEENISQLGIGHQKAQSMVCLLSAITVKGPL